MSFSFPEEVLTFTSASTKASFLSFKLGASAVSLPALPDFQAAAFFQP